MRPPQQDVYVEIPRDDVAPFIPEEAQSVADIGCGPGGFGPSLRKRLGHTARLVGVEAVPQQAARARDGHGFDEVIDGYFPEALAGRQERFDVLVFNDVLEHLVDPWTALRDAQAFLNPRGRVVAAIPNIQFAPVVWKLIRGRWDYADQGTLDRTHLRFFTKATMVEMFGQCGFEVQTCVGTNSWGRDLRASRRPWRRLTGLVLPRLMRDARFVHFIIVATPR